MRLISVETTPNPNSMKLNLSESLSLVATVSRADLLTQAERYPRLIVDLLALDGVHDLYLCNNFISLNRDPRKDWKPLLEAVSVVFGAASASLDSNDAVVRSPFLEAGEPPALPGGVHTCIPAVISNGTVQVDESLAGKIAKLRQEAEKAGKVKVFVQSFRRIPIQVKVSDGQAEKRIALESRFNDAVKRVQQESGADFLKERCWIDYGERYGALEDIASEVADEIQGSIADGKLDALVRLALASSNGSAADLQSPDSNLHALELQSRQAAGAPGACAPELVSPTAVSGNTTDAIRASLDSDDWHQRLNALQAIECTEEMLPILLLALNDDSPQVRRLAAASIGATGSRSAVSYLAERFLNDPSVAVRRTAGDALSDIADPSAQSAACRALKDPNKLVRWRAARFLADIGSAEALPFLEDARDDDQFEVKLEIEAAIQRISGGKAESLPAWKKILDSVSASQQDHAG